MTEQTNAVAENSGETTKETGGVDTSNIHVNADPNVTLTNVSFHFKTSKDLGVKRATVDLSIPVPSVQGIVAILEAGGKELELLLETAAEVIISQAREQVNAKDPFTQSDLDVSKLSWHVIANLPKAERRGGGIAAEVWEAFQKDYIDLMPGLTGKTPEQVTNAAKLFVAKFNPCKSNKKVLAVLRQQLSLWFENTKAQEEFSSVFEFLDGKADTLLKADDAAMLANL